MKTQSITEGSMLAAITILLALIGVYIGFVGIIVPVPLALLVYRHGLRVGIIVALVTAFLGALTLSSIFLAVELIIIGLLGIALGMALREGFNFTQTLIVGIVASIIITLLQVLAYSVIFGENLLNMYLETWEQSSEHWLVIWENLGISPEMLAQYEEMLAAIPSTVRLLIPVLVFGVALIRTLVNLFFIRVILKRLGVSSIPWFPPFKYWKWPWYFVWGFILGRVFLVISFYYPHEIWEVIGLNLDVLFLYMFVVQGLAILWFYFDKYEVHKLLRVLFVFLMLQFGSVLLVIVSIVGMLDTWFDFRKLKDSNNMEGEK